MTIMIGQQYTARKTDERRRVPYDDGCGHRAFAKASG
jgi:hypothetical protein